MDHGEHMARFEQADLYVVITEAFCGGRPALDVLDCVLSTGVTLIQFREKEGTDRALFEKAAAFRKRTSEAGALLIVDDRVDLALAVGADGVHLGEYDLPVDAARGIAPDLIIGASAHNLNEALDAQARGASYVNIGPIFATRTKTLPFPPLGPEALSKIVPQLHIPFSTMGGIKLENIDEVVQRGARRIAVVTAVTEAQDVESAARALRERIAAAT
jgi:thiamine-phosphate pyrophosphorylase